LCDILPRWLDDSWFTLCDMKTSAPLWACSLLVALPALADGSNIQARAAWLRAPVGQGEVAAGYVTLENKGPDDRLIAAESAAAERVEIHDMTFEKGVMKMRHAKEGLAVARGASLALKPRGPHLMFIRPRTNLTEGQAVKVTLRFAHAAPIELSVPVLSATATGPAATAAMQTP
jgi:periplasmic copper chaperone A